MGLNEDFQAAADQIKKLKQTPKDEELLELYALYKQATAGDAGEEKPGMFDFKGKAKFDAWSKKKGISSDAAKESYVAYAKTLAETYGV